jgi:hypothetical protein
MFSSVPPLILFNASRKCSPDVPLMSPIAYLPA